MAEMANPMNALEKLQVALGNGIVSLTPCDIHEDISVIFDQPNGYNRYTYVSLKDGIVRSIALFVLMHPIDGIPCFQMGWATIEPERGKGIASDVTSKGIDELSNGLKRNGVVEFYLEAVISATNHPSMKLADKILSVEPKYCIDEYTSEPAVRYLHLAKN